VLLGTRMIGVENLDIPNCSTYEIGFATVVIEQFFNASNGCVKKQLAYVWASVGERSLDNVSDSKVNLCITFLNPLGQLYKTIIRTKGGKLNPMFGPFLQNVFWDLGQ